jgi:chromatin modification-related protein VID21
MKPIEKLLNQAHKTISTSDQYISILDHQACKILRRVYHLQQHDKWSLRQPVRCPEPTRPASHWDVTLQEMKWMRTDFREERKWKRAVARNLAHACAEWIHSGPAERLALQVNAVIPPLPVAGGGDGDAIGSSDLLEDALPDLDHSDSPMGNDDDALEMLVETVAPSAIFALQDDEVIFGLQPSKAADLLLENLPMHGSPLQVPKFDVSGTDYDPDAKWKRPAVPLSKFVEGEMVLASGGPPRKRRRYDYLAEDEDEDDIEVTFGSEPDLGAELQAENSAVALFNPEMKTIRDRLHAGHQFRPPTEHPMPPQSFFECRTASQWTWAEDEQLKSLVRECSYNWSLISAMASTTSTFASGAERRTPWECFERWVSLGSLEGLPNDMARTPYFKAYQSRIDAAQRIIAQQNQTAQQQVGPNGAVTPVPRRRATTTIRVERRRNQKHLALIDAMRKLAKKRETAAQKAQHAANLAAMRKANEVPRQQIQNKTPRDYSIMRWERDQALAERMAAYALRHADANARRLVKSPGFSIISSN